MNVTLICMMLANMPAAVSPYEIAAGVYCKVIEQPTENPEGGYYNPKGINFCDKTRELDSGGFINYSALM